MISATDYGVSALMVYILTSVFKPFLEASFVPVQRNGVPYRMHDPIIRLVAFVIGAVTAMALFWVYAPHQTTQGLVTAALVGLGAALTAIGTFHLTTGNFFDAGDASALSAAAATDAALHASQAVDVLSAMVNAHSQVLHEQTATLKDVAETLAQAALPMQPPLQMTPGVVPASAEVAVSTGEAA